MVGAVFLHQSGATPLPKCTATQFLSSHFTKQVAAFFAWDIHYPIVIFCGLLFLPHSDQRKEAKERR